MIDDGSTDDTPAVCERYKDAIRIYRSPNQGFEASLTKAVQYAAGDIICLLDADDYFLPEKLSQVADAFNGDASLLFLYHDKAFINEEGKILKEYAKGGNTSTQVFKRKAALDLLPANNEQFFYTLYLAKRGKHLRKSLSHYRIHSSSMSRPKNLFVWKRELLQMNVRHLRMLKRLIKDSPEWATKNTLKEVYADIAAGYNYIKMEIAFNNGQNYQALKNYCLILRWELNRKHPRVKSLKLFISFFLLGRYVKYRSV